MIRTIRLIAWREMVERSRSKPFITSTAITFAIVLGVAVVPGLVDDDGPVTYDVAVAGGAQLAPDLGGVALELHRVEPGEAERLVADGTVDAAVVGREVVVHERLDGRLELVLQASVAGAEPLSVRALDPVDEDEETRDQLVFFGTLLLYGQLFGFGYWVATGLVEDKSSRVAELLLTKATPGQVLAGKVVGLGVVGFAQMVGIVAVGLGAAVAAGTVDPPPGTPGVIAMVLGWFVLGYAFYSCVFAVGGALASRADELQSTTMPLSMLVLVSLFVAMGSNDDPGGTVTRIATYVPTTAPLVLPVRMAHGELPWWELGAAVATLLAATVLAIRLAARAYAGAALHVRGTVKLRDALSQAG